MPPRTDIALFLDLETTGNLDDDEIIEVGCSLIETANWTERSSFSAVVVPSVAAWDRMVGNPVVFAMHTKNGLISDLIGPYDGPPEVTIDTIDALLDLWLDEHAGTDGTHIPLGGSGVSHFDRKYMKRDLPRLNKRLTFWAWDAGDLRRAFRLAGRPWLVGNSSKSHRALDDARFHAAEWHYGVEAIRTGFDPEVMAAFETTVDF